MFILIYWIPNVQLIMKTNVSDYVFAAIFSIIDENNKIHPVVSYFRTFTFTELNYNTHDKKLLAIFEAFKI